jgi:hypothetical protein
MNLLFASGTNVVARAWSGLVQWFISVVFET